MGMSILSKRIRPHSTQLQRAKYLMLMWRVCVVGFWALPMVVQLSLSLYAMVAASWGMSRSQRILRTKRHIPPTSTAAMNSASVNERATVDWNLVLYPTVPPASWIQIPLKEHRVLTQVAQPESPYATAVVDLWLGCSSNNISWQLLLTEGRAPSERSGRKQVCQK